MKSKFLAAALSFLLLLPTNLLAAIAIGTVTNSTEVNSTTTQTTSITVASGTDRVLVACMALGSTISGNNVTDLTFNGTEVFNQGNSVGELYDTGASFYYVVQMFYLINPTVTTANAVATYGNSNSNLFQRITYIQYTGVDQTTPFEANNINKGNSATVSVIVTTATANAWLQDCAFGEDGLTVGAGQTARRSTAVNGGWMGVSTVDGKATPGAETMDWTLASDHWVSAAVSLKPAAEAGGSTRSRVHRHFSGD